MTSGPLSNRPPDPAAATLVVDRHPRPHQRRRPPPNSGDTLLSITSQLYQELNSHERPSRADLDASFDRDWGFDSLSRAELFLRIERALGVTLPERLLTEARTLRDLKDAFVSAPAEIALSATKAVPTAAAGEAAPMQLETLTEVLDWHAKQHGEKCHAIILGDGDQEFRFSYKELAGEARRLAGGIQQAGITPGDRVGIMLPTGKDYLVAYFGCLYAGASPAPIYPPARPAELAQHLRRQAGILRNADAKLLIVDERIHRIGRLLQFQVGTAMRLRMVNELARAPESDLPPVGADQLALLQYTSGSTGDPKGVLLTHANLVANIQAIGAVIHPLPSDVFVSWLPLYHDMGLIGAWLSSLVYGVPLILMSPLQFLARPERWLWAIHRHRGTLTAAPNFAYQICIDQIESDRLEGLDLSSLRMAANGSESVSPDTLRSFLEQMKRYGFRPEAMCPAYGLAENGVGLTIKPPGIVPMIDRVDRRKLEDDGRAVSTGDEATDAIEFVSCGLPLPNSEIRIVGPTGELPDREEGELEFRGPSATAGYLNNPGKNRELFDGSWLRTGDLAYISDGSLFVTGRTKDIIIRAGQHIYPQEVEETLGSVPGLRRGGIAAFGSTDTRTGTEKLILLAETGEQDPEQLLRLKQSIAEVVHELLGAPPEQIILAPPGAVPKTSSGKIRRAFARQLYERKALASRPAAVRWQMFALAAEAIGAQARRLGRSTLALLYGVYWWLVVSAIGLVAWPLILLLPVRSWRWASLKRMARLAFAVLRVPLEYNEESVIPGTAILVANHSSYLDGLVLAAVLPHPLWFVAKRELSSQMIAGPFLRALGTIFVERELEGAIESERALLNLDTMGKRVLVFPEGTFTRAQSLQSFHLGAFALAAAQAVPVVPIAIRGARSVLPDLRQLPRRGTIGVEVGSPILASGRGFQAVLRLREAAREFIASRINESAPKLVLKGP